MSMLKFEQQRYHPPAVYHSYKEQPQLPLLSVPPFLQQQQPRRTHHPQHRFPSSSPPLSVQKCQPSGHQRSPPPPPPAPLLQQGYQPRRGHHPHQRTPSSSPSLFQQQYQPRQALVHQYQQRRTHQELPSPPDSVVSTTSPTCYYYCHPITGKFVCMVQTRPMQPPARSVYQGEEDTTPLVFFAKQDEQPAQAVTQARPSPLSAEDYYRQRRRQRSMPHPQLRQKSPPHHHPEKATAADWVSRHPPPPPPPMSPHRLPNPMTLQRRPSTHKSQRPQLSRSVSVPIVKPPLPPSPAVLLCGCGGMYKNKPKEKPATANGLMSKARRWFSLSPKNNSNKTK